MRFRTVRPEEVEAALAVAGETVSAEYLAMYERCPDLFTCCSEGPQIIGVCCGWPVRSDRDGLDRMRLHVIAILPGQQRRGYGSRLLRYWEDRVRARGDWTIDLGSGADGFYLRVGYTPLEYAVKVPKDKLPHDYRNLGFEISYVRDPADPGGDEVCLYTRVGDRYRAEVLEKLRQVFGASSSFTVFEKRVIGSRASGPAAAAD